MDSSNCRPVSLCPLTTKLENSISVHFFTSPPILCSTHSTWTLAPSWHWNLFRITRELHLIDQIIDQFSDVKLLDFLAIFPTADHSFFKILSSLGFQNYPPFLVCPYLTGHSLSLHYSLLIVFPSSKFVVPRKYPSLPPCLLSILSFLPFWFYPFFSYLCSNSSSNRISCDDGNIVYLVCPR